MTGANGYEQTFTTDENGEIFIEGLRVGDYTVSEVSDGASANYVLPADKQVTILADKTTVAQMHNELRDTPKPATTASRGSGWLSWEYPLRALPPWAFRPMQVSAERERNPLSKAVWTCVRRKSSWS